MIRASTAKKINAVVSTSSQSAHQADGSSPLVVIGETRFQLTRDNISFHFEGLVVENLDVEVLAGIPFMTHNDISIRPSKRQVLIGDDLTCTYGSPSSVGKPSTKGVHVLRASVSTTIWPGEFIELQLPDDSSFQDATLAVEPHIGNQNPHSPQHWPQPSLLHSVSKSIRVPNLTSDAILVKKNDHFCQVCTVFTPAEEAGSNEDYYPHQTVLSTPGYSDSIFHVCFDRSRWDSTKRRPG